MTLARVSILAFAVLSAVCFSVSADAAPKARGGLKVVRGCAYLVPSAFPPFVHKVLNGYKLVEAYPWWQGVPVRTRVNVWGTVSEIGIGGSGPYLNVVRWTPGIGSPC